MQQGCIPCAYQLQMLPEDNLVEQRQSKNIILSQTNLCAIRRSEKCIHSVLQKCIKNTEVGNTQQSLNIPHD